MATRFGQTDFKRAETILSDPQPQSNARLAEPEPILEEITPENNVTVELNDE